VQSEVNVFVITSEGSSKWALVMGDFKLALVTMATLSLLKLTSAQGKVVLLQVHVIVITLRIKPVAPKCDCSSAAYLC
jgi:hypothetical protein